MTKGILFYSDCILSPNFVEIVAKYISASGFHITSVTLSPMDFGKNILFEGERSYVTMFKQIQRGLEEMTEDVIFFAESDVLYHPSHYEFVPVKDNVYYYNGNYWVLRLEDGFAIHYDLTPLSGLVAYREPLLTHFKERNAFIKRRNWGLALGFEPFTHDRYKWKDWYDADYFYPEFPNIDIVHGANYTQKKFRWKNFLKKPAFWVEGNINTIPGWPDLPKILEGI